MTDQLTIEELAADAQAQQQPKADRIVTLNDVRALAESQKVIEEQIEALEAQITLKKAEHKKIAEYELPEMLNFVGLPSITLSDGSTITVKENIHASITDENREAAHTWLRQNGYEDLIKNVVSVSFGKGEDKDALLLVHNINVMADQGALKFGTVDQKEAVHASTLRAFVKERLKTGEPLPVETFKLFIGQVCEIRKPKVKA